MPNNILQYFGSPRISLLYADNGDGSCIKTFNPLAAHLVARCFPSAESNYLTLIRVKYQAWIWALTRINTYLQTDVKAEVCNLTAVYSCIQIGTLIKHFICATYAAIKLHSTTHMLKLLLCGEEILSRKSFKQPRAVICVVLKTTQWKFYKRASLILAYSFDTPSVTPVTSP